MKIVDEIIYSPYVCAFVGQHDLVLTPAIKEKTRRALLWQINEGRNYFYFGTLGPWERFCFEELKKLQKTHTNIRLVHFRLEGDFTCTEEDAEAIDEMMGFKGQSHKPYLCFDAIYDCRDKLYEGLFPMLSLDRMRTMFKHSGICLAWFEYEPEDLPKDLKKKIRWLKIMEFEEDSTMTRISYTWVKGTNIPTVNLAKQEPNNDSYLNKLKLKKYQKKPKENK